jgi:hypothetical protein
VCFFNVASCPSSLRCPKWWRRFLDLFNFLGRLPQGIVSGFCWCKTLQAFLFLLRSWVPQQTSEGLHILYTFCVYINIFGLRTARRHCTNCFIQNYFHLKTLTDRDIHTSSWIPLNNRLTEQSMPVSQSQKLQRCAHYGHCCGQFCTPIDVHNGQSPSMWSVRPPIPPKWGPKKGTKT